MTGLCYCRHAHCFLGRPAGTPRGLALPAPRYAGMDVLISMGTLSAYIWGIVAFFIPNAISFMGISGMIMAFQLLGRYLEAIAKSRTLGAIRKLLELGAKQPVL